MRLLKKEYHDDFVRLTYQDESGDHFIETLPLEQWNAICHIGQKSDRQLINAKWRDWYHGAMEYIDGISDAHVLCNTEHDPICNLIVEKDDVQRIYRAIELLTEPQKSRVRAYLISGLTYQQIADRDGVNVASVYRSVQTAIENIKKIIL